MSQYQLMHQFPPIGKQTPEQIEATRARVEADPDRFRKWHARGNLTTFKTWGRTLPDGAFYGRTKRDG